MGDNVSYISPAIYRRAIAQKIFAKDIKVDEKIIVEDISDWTIYEIEDKYHAIRCVNTQQSKYCFYFDEAKIIESDTAKKIFETLYADSSSTNQLTISFHLAIAQPQPPLKYVVLTLSNINNIKLDGNLIKKDNNDYGKKHFEVTEVNQTYCVRLLPYPRAYNQSSCFDKTQVITLDEKEIEQIQTNYRQENFDKTDYNRILNRSYSDYQKEQGSETKEEFIKNFMSNDKFKGKFFSKEQVRKCIYCGVREDQLNLLQTVRSGRGERLEYDRLISRHSNGDKKVYEIDNIELACYWCNNAKTDTFSPKEFKEIARGINRVWNEKLKLEQKAPNETIYFEENSTIWDIDHDSKCEK